MPADAPPVLKLRFAYVRAIDTYFSKRFADAQNKMYAALREARKSSELSLISECESALALFMQREGDVRAAVTHARSVLANSAATLEARYRASLALASLHQDAHDHETAYRLYRETHDVVKDLDDEIAMASWLQRAALAKAAHARQSAGSGVLDKAGVKQAIADLQQCIEYAQQVPDGPTTTLDHLLLAEMYVLQKRYQPALALYDRHLPQCEGDGFLHECTVAMADRANCLLQLGQTDAGYAQAVAALRRLDQSAPAEIRAIVHENMAAALDVVKQPAQAHQHRTMAQAAWDAHDHEQSETRRLLHECAVTTLH
jgi:tetratricopeptide (TPR) repeat protein